MVVVRGRQTDGDPGGRRSRHRGDVRPRQRVGRRCGAQEAGARACHVDDRAGHRRQVEAEGAGVPQGEGRAAIDRDRRRSAGDRLHREGVVVAQRGQVQVVERSAGKTDGLQGSRAERLGRGVSAHGHARGRRQIHRARCPGQRPAAGVAAAGHVGEVERGGAAVSESAGAAGDGNPLQRDRIGRAPEASRCPRRRRR